MNKFQAADVFWNSFGVPAYDESSVPDNAVMPYITYSVSAGAMDEAQFWSASLWYRSTSWADISLKAEEVSRVVGEHGYFKMEIDGGYLWVVRGDPFLQRAPDDDDTVRRIYINVRAEYLTAY